MPNALAARAEANLLHAVKACAAASAGHAISEHDGFLVAASGVPIRAFNNVLLTRPLSETSPSLKEVIGRFQSQRLPFRLRVRDDVDGMTERVLLAAGLEREGGIPPLALEPLAVRETGGPGLEIRPVVNELSLRDHVSVVASAFGWPEPLLGQVFTERLIANEIWSGYTGYVDGRPVATSQLVVEGRVAGVYYVTTLEGHRRRGFGEALTRHAINEGAVRGCDIASLQASPMGQPIYERMGFRTVCYYRSYVLPDL